LPSVGKSQAWLFINGKRKENTMKSLMAHFLNVFDYLFNAEWNPEYANAPHIKIVPDIDNRYSNNILIQAIDCNNEIIAMCSYDGQKALEPMEVEYEPLDDILNDEENREWFIQRAKDFEFHPIVSRCSMCNDREAHYNGITQAVSGNNWRHNGVIFQFCKICRDELQMIKLQTIALRERIGA
jgi:hypothetical protein